jgi:hypothetical protein
MSRLGCPEEDEAQSASPGTVADSEMIVFALIFPEAANEESLARFEKGKMKTRSVSISRSAHSNHAEMMDKVVTPQLANPHRKYLGFQVATCEEVRSVMIVAKDGSQTELGAICVIDDAYDDYTGHARMGFSEHNPEFWKRNNREAARGNLAITLARRGVFSDPAQWP